MNYSGLDYWTEGNVGVKSKALMEPVGYKSSFVVINMTIRLVPEDPLTSHCISFYIMRIRSQVLLCKRASNYEIMASLDW